MHEPVISSAAEEAHVVADPNVRYSGAKIGERTLVPGKDARLGETRFETWLKESAEQIPGNNVQTAASTAVVRH